MNRTYPRKSDGPNPQKVPRQERVLDWGGTECAEASQCEGDACSGSGHDQGEKGVVEYELIDPGRRLRSDSGLEMRGSRLIGRALSHTLSTETSGRKVAAYMR